MYNSFSFKSDYDGAPIKIVCNADVYTKKKKKIRVNGGGKEFAIKLRIPGWMEKYAVVVDGEKIAVDKADGYVSIDRLWETNVIEVSFSAGVKAHILNGKIAFTKGPIVLARDARFGDITKPVPTEKRNIVEAKRIKNDKFKNNVTYEISVGNERFLVCDYSSAGKDYDDENSCVTVWQNIKNQ